MRDSHEIGARMRDQDKHPPYPPPSPTTPLHTPSKVYPREWWFERIGFFLSVNADDFSPAIWRSIKLNQ